MLSRRRLVVWYDRAPLVLRVAQRLVKVASTSSMRLVGRLTRIEFLPLRHELQITDYPRLHADALERTYLIVTALIDEGGLATDIEALYSLRAEDAALSCVTKFLADREIMPSVLGLQILQADPAVGSVNFWLPVTWPRRLGSLVTGGKSGDPAVVEGPRKLRAAMARLVGICRAAAMALELSWALVRRGIRITGRAHGRYVVAAEYLDRDPTTGGLRDVEGLLGNGRFRAEEILLFVTPAQERVLRRLRGRGWAGSVRRTTRERGIRLVRLAGLSYALDTLHEALRLPALAALWAFRRPGIVPLVSRRLLSEFLEWAPLFDHADIGILVYNTFPNGPGSFRTDSGLVTALANRRGTLVAGLQTRSFYLRKWEDAFDCYDLYFFWGPRYEELVGQSGTRWLRHVEVLGNPNLKSDLLESGACHDPSPGTRRTVLAFTGDVHPAGAFFKHHYTYDYTVRFLVGLAEFARSHPNTYVEVKLKDPVGEDLYRGDARLRDLIPSNFRFLSLERDHYAQVLGRADVVAAMGFTSPGTDAILLRKPTIFYSELGTSRNAFAWGSGIIAHSISDFVDDLAEIVEDPRQRIAGQESLAVELDPFADGRAYHRIVGALRSAVRDMAYVPPNRS